MIIEKGNVLIKTSDEGVNNDNCPATVEIIDAATGKVICKLKAVNKPGPGADGNTYPFIQFEEISIEESQEREFTHEEQFLLNMQVIDTSRNQSCGGQFL